MSIWCSSEVIGFDDWGIDPPNGQVRTYVSGWSNHYPTTDGTAEREAWIDTAYVAPWCTPGWRDRVEACDEMVGPWLRLSVGGPETSIGEGLDVVVGPVQDVSVVLDEVAVRALRDMLSTWLEYPKTTPAEGGEPDT